MREGFIFITQSITSILSAFLLVGLWAFFWQNCGNCPQLSPPALTASGWVKWLSYYLIEFIQHNWKCLVRQYLIQVNILGRVDRDGC